MCDVNEGWGMRMGVGVWDMGGVGTLCRFVIANNLRVRTLQPDWSEHRYNDLCLLLTLSH